MRKIKEVLRLHALGLAQRQIARSCSLSQSTVSEYLKAAEAARLQWSEVAGWEEARLVAALLPKPAVKANPSRQPAPDYASIHTGLQQHKHLTLQLVWEEYRAQNPDGYRYSRFCELYQRWRRKQEVVLRQEHRAGEKLFVDYAGQTIPVQSPYEWRDARSAVVRRRTRRQQLHLRRGDLDAGVGDWYRFPHPSFRVHGRSQRDRGAGQSEVRQHKDLPLRAGRESHLREMAHYYGVAFVPARPRKPRDKAKVEAGVLLVERWILAALRKRRFFSLGEVNEAIAELLVRD